MQLPLAFAVLIFYRFSASLAVILITRPCRRVVPLGNTVTALLKRARNANLIALHSLGNTIPFCPWYLPLLSL